MDHSYAKIGSNGQFSGGGFINTPPSEVPAESVTVLLCQVLQDTVAVQGLLCGLEGVLGVPQSPTSASDKASTSNVVGLARLLSSQTWDIKTRIEQILKTVGKLG